MYMLISATTAGAAAMTFGGIAAMLHRSSPALWAALRGGDAMAQAVRRARACA